MTKQTIRTLFMNVNFPKCSKSGWTTISPYFNFRLFLYSPLDTSCNITTAFGLGISLLMKISSTHYEEYKAVLGSSWFSWRISSSNFFLKIGIVPVLLLKWKKKRFWFQFWVQFSPKKFHFQFWETDLVPVNSNWNWWLASGFSL